MSRDPALDTGKLLAMSSDELLRLVEGRRWFDAKSGRPSDARIAAVVPVDFDGEQFAVTLLEVTIAGGDRREYQLPLAVSDGGALVDATAHAGFRNALAATCARGAVFEGDGLRWAIRPVGTPLVLPSDVEVGLMSAEQSNTSLRVGEAAVLKLYRRLQPGVHPEVEVTEFLTRRHSYPHAAVLLAVIEFEREGEAIAAGMMQELVPEALDAWRYALQCGEPFFGGPPGSGDDRGKKHVDTVGHGAGEIPFVADARRLGVVTRDLHEVLASDPDHPEFAPDPVDEDELARWGETVQRQVEEGLALLERSLASRSLPAEREAEATALLRRRDQFLARVREIVDAIGDDAGLMIRHHGDYHLGQVLRSSSGEFIIIDFEGEPARPLEERRRRHSALRDVAGMLRSFSYAAATLATTAGAKLDARTREVISGRWERACRTAFVEGYLTGSDDGADTGLLPDSRRDIDLIIDLFETEKVFYELAYELNNRPEWAWIPLRGISQLMFAR